MRLCRSRFLSFERVVVVKDFGIFKVVRHGEGWFCISEMFSFGPNEMESSRIKVINDEAMQRQAIAKSEFIYGNGMIF